MSSVAYEDDNNGSRSGSAYLIDFGLDTSGNGRDWDCVNDDVFPGDPNKWANLDGDGIGDISDPNKDDNGVGNNSDAYPADPTRSSLYIVTIGSPQTSTAVGYTPLTISGSDCIML